ncbi:hypothetical protein B9Z19DRAFT_1068961 [Tuber borchii]|uniref:C2H2-type domain-containing protein n=1 Tax=Tuber borchii TaxID=42251 RepID=A0A2T6ZD95_TUBBO|nr:hypothetical protein B9Z19DRAFT_1068961 [Tuber borchii]
MSSASNPDVNLNPYTFTSPVDRCKYIVKPNPVTKLFHSFCCDKGYTCADGRALGRHLRRKGHVDPSEWTRGYKNVIQVVHSSKETIVAEPDQNISLGPFDLRLVDRQQVMSLALVPESAAPILESPCPIPESPAPVPESYASLLESPAPIPESPAPVPEFPAPISESSAPVLECPPPIINESTFPYMELGLFRDLSTDWSLDWVSSDIQFSGSDMLDINAFGQGRVSEPVPLQDKRDFFEGIPLQDKIDFFEGLEKVGMEDTALSPICNSILQPLPTIHDSSSSYGTGLEITSSLAKELDIAEEFGPIENLHGHKIIWDNATAVAFFVEYNILVCTQCKKSLTNIGIVNHIRNSHPEIDSAAGQALEGKYANFLYSPNETPNPPPESCPIPFLPIVPGYSCPLCQYCIIESYNLVRPLRTVHQSVWSEKACPRAKLQTWYSGNTSRYFSIHKNKCSCCSPVIPSHSGQINITSILTNVESKIESKLEAHMRLLSQHDSFSLHKAFPKNSASSNDYERTPLDAWLEKTKWVEHFQTTELAQVVEVREELANQVQRD